MDQTSEMLQKMMTQATESGMDPLDFIQALGLSVMFGLMLNQLYGLYFRDNEPQDGSLARSLVLLTPSLTATFLLVQSSLALSLGLLGSLSFVRFRTPVKRAEDVSFIIIAVAVSIACAVGTYLLASALVGILFIYTLLRNAIDGRRAHTQRHAIITFNTRRHTSSAEVQQLFERLHVKGEFISSRTYDGITSYVFNAAKVTRDSHDAITHELTEFDKEAHVNVFYPSDRLGA